MKKKRNVFRWLFRKKRRVTQRLIDNNLLRSYIYVSTTKVRQIVDQMPPKLRTELNAKLKLKVVELGLKQKTEERLRPVRQLAAVCQYMNDGRLAGDIRHHKEQGFIYDQMSMKWGVLCQDRPFRSPKSREVVHKLVGAVLFIGHQHNRTVVLGGSPKHVTGYEHMGDDIIPGSVLPAIVEVLATANRHLEEQDTVAPVGLDVLADSELVDSIAFAERSLRASQKLEFLAIPLSEQRVGKQHVIIGSPVWVALT